jgi:hypothetical protein
MIGIMIAESLQMSLRYAESLAEGISSAEFGRQARVDGHVVDSNNPAWVFGHLAIYAPRIVTELGNDASTIAVDEAWEAVFSPKTKSEDDIEGSRYPAKEVLVEKLLRGYGLAMESLRAADDAKFTAENPNERMRARFATVGGMHGFYCGGHFMIHMGQISAWRRMMGLGPAM